MRRLFFLYIMGYVVLIAAICFLYIRSPGETLIRYEPEDAIITDGDDFLSWFEKSDAIKRVGSSVFTFENEGPYVMLPGQAENIGEVIIILRDLSCAEIPGLLYVGEEIEGKPLGLTKGVNAIHIAGNKGNVQIVLMPKPGDTINVQKAAVAPRGARRHFPQNLSVILTAAYVGTCMVFGPGPHKKRRIVPGLCMAFLFFMMQLRNTWYCFDDYGYLSLTYRGFTDNRGLSYGAGEIFSFLARHYLEWGGRVTAFFLEIVLGRNIAVFRVIYSLILTGIVYEICRLKQGMPALWVLLMFGFIDLSAAADGALWYTASVLYVWPVYWCLLGLRIERENKKTRFRRILSCLCLFLAASAQEQISAAVVAMFAMDAAADKDRRRRVPEMISVVAGAAFLFGAPGNYARLRESSGGEIRANSFHLLPYICSDSARCSVLLFLLSGGTAGLLLILRYRSMHLIAHAAAVFVLSAAFRMAVGCCGLASACRIPAGLIPGGRNGRFFLYVSAAVLIVSFLEQVFYIRRFYPGLIKFFAGALAASAVMLVSPQISARMFLPAFFFMMPATGVIMTDLYRTVIEACRSSEPFGGGGRLKRIYTAAVSCFAFALAGTLLAHGGMNADERLVGYFRNTAAEEYNISVLENYEDFADDNGLITLKKHYDDEYGNIMPYMHGYEWIQDYINAMYDLPGDAVVRFMDRR